MSATPIALIVAMAENRVIGRDGKLPWRIAADMAWFREKTAGKPLIMGRRTWDSLPKKPLPGRANIVVTRNPSFADEGAIVARSLDEAIAAARAAMPEASEIMVIGGAAIYAAALAKAERIYLTEIHARVPGDTHMPAFGCRFIETSRARHPKGEGADHAFSFVVLDKLP